MVLELVEGDREKLKLAWGEVESINFSSDHETRYLVFRPALSGWVTCDADFEPLYGDLDDDEIDDDPAETVINYFSSCRLNTLNLQKRLI